VNRSYRKRGLTLKMRSVAYAKARGCSAIWTGNDALNTPILTLNERLGFVCRRPSWFELVRGEDATLVC